MSKTITVNVEETIEKDFRRVASRKYGKKKGYLGRALTQAMQEWAEKREVDVEAEALALLKTGIKMKKWRFDRDELHER